MTEDPKDLWVNVWRHIGTGVRFRGALEHATKQAAIKSFEEYIKANPTDTWHVEYWNTVTLEEYRHNPNVPKRPISRRRL